MDIIIQSEHHNFIPARLIYSTNMVVINFQMIIDDTLVDACTKTVMSFRTIVLYIQRKKKCPTELFISDDNRLNEKARSYIKYRRRDNVEIHPLRNGSGRVCEQAHEMQR